jgi:hypothetical protein
MEENFLEKRREPRLPASGHLSIQLVDAGPTVSIDGELMDCSDHGFRASHRHRGLMAGQEVTFRHAQAHGRARVVWNKIVAGTVETGFFVLHS